MHAVDGGAYIGFPSGGLRCYNDVTYAIKMSDLSCDSISQPYLSIADIEKYEHDIYVYPNPANDIIIIESERLMSQEIKLQLFDITVRQIKILRSPMGQRRISYDISNLSNGLYLIKFITKVGTFYNKLLVKH